MSGDMNNTEQNESLVDGLVSENTDTLTEAEKDTLGEVGNISMGRCATTLYSLLGKRVHITTPRVTVDYTQKHVEDYNKPFLCAKVSYTEGIGGYNIFILKQEDAIVITDLLMGGSGDVDEDAELDELAFSAISEVMNQMIGSSSTSLAEFIGKTINISVPEVEQYSAGDGKRFEFAEDAVTVKISFTMEIEDLMITQIMQIIPMYVAKEILDKLLYSVDNNAKQVEEDKKKEQIRPERDMTVQNIPVNDEIKDAYVATSNIANTPETQQNNIQAELIESTIIESESKVSEPRYQSFDNGGNQSQAQTQTSSISFGDNIDLVMEVPLEVSVELGTCKKSIRDILGLSVGSIIVLDKLVGEMVEVKANGRIFAVGEVVVIEDSYGVRLTEIFNNSKK